MQEYSEDSNSEPDVDLENQYYNSKALRSDDPKAALTSFQKVLELEGNDKGEWGFRALKQMIKINFTLVSYTFSIKKNSVPVIVRKLRGRKRCATAETTGVGFFMYLSSMTDYIPVIPMSTLL